ncbi:MAG: DUF3142 domain-containing protein [Limisphaerales bacterium]
MKYRVNMLAAKLKLTSIILITLMCMAILKVPARSGLTNEVYVWQRAWTQPVRDSVREHATNFNSLVALAAEMAWHDHKPQVTHIAIDYPALAKARTPVGLALRIGPYSGPFVENDAATDFLTALVTSLVAEARANQVELRELQIDFDCATAKLDGYRVWVEAIQRKLSPMPVTITALPSWLDAAAFTGLAHSASNYVLQVHSLARPANFNAPFTLCDPHTAQQAVKKAARIGVPFRVALPTYGYVLAFDRNGKFFDLSAEGPRKNWPDDVQLREVRSDPIELSALVKNWATNRPALMQGVIWYRLPVAVDNLNWRWPTLNAMLGARVPRESFRADARRVEPGLVEISLVNNGDLDISSRLALEVHWTDARLVAGDGLRDFKLAEPDVSAARFITQPKFRPLPAGEERVVGWLRFNTNCEVQVEVKKN